IYGHFHLRRAQGALRLARRPQRLGEWHARPLAHDPAVAVEDPVVERQTVAVGGRRIEADPYPRAALVHVGSDQHAGEEDGVNDLQIDTLPDAADGPVP